MITFPLSLEDMPAAVQMVDTLMKGTAKKNPLTIKIPAEVSKKTHRELVPLWNRLSKALVGKGIRKVRLFLPMDGRLLNIPGLFGCPRHLGGAGDEHWRVAEYPTGANGMDIILRRLGNPDEDRRRAVVRHEGCHVTAYPERVGSRSRGVVRGVLNPLLIGTDEVSLRPGGKEVVNHRGTNKLPNPTAALADALAEWLTGYEEQVPVTVWLADDLIRSAIRGNHTDTKHTDYRGVRPPDMHRALLRLQRAVSDAVVEVQFTKAKRCGAMSRGIIGTAAAVEKVKALADELVVSPRTN